MPSVRASSLSAHSVIVQHSVSQLQGFEVWQTHGTWITQHSTNISPSTLDRFNFTSEVTKAEYAAATSKRQIIKQHMDQLLGRDGVLAVPTTPGPAVPLNTPPGQPDDYRRYLLCLTCVAGLAGLPQVRLNSLFTQGIHTRVASPIGDV